MSDAWTDGNSLGGPVREVLGVDITMATGRCSSCGTAGRWPRDGCSAARLGWCCGARTAEGCCCA